MINLYDTYDTEENILNEIVRDASNLCQHIDFDNWKIVMISKDKLYGTILYTSEDDVNYNIDLSKDNYYLNLVIKEKKIISYINEDREVSDHVPLSKEAAVEIYFPLMSNINKNGNVLGILYLSKNEVISNLKEIIIDTQVKSYVLDIQKYFEITYFNYLRDSELMYLIHTFYEINKKKNPLMKDHPFNVAFLSVTLGQELNLSEDELYNLYIAALLHDVGMLYIPEEILNKPESERNQLEKVEIQMHPVYGHNIVKDLVNDNNKLSGIDKIILQHHEMYDGSGFPQRLKGDKILLESKIIAIANEVDIMLSERNSKGPKAINQVIKELKLLKGKKFDPILTQKMIDILINKQNNQDVLLSVPICIGALVITTKENVYSLQGTLINDKEGYVFIIDCDERFNIKYNDYKKDLIGSTFYSEQNKNLYEFNVNIKFSDADKIYISSLTPMPSTNYFNLLWKLNGVVAFNSSVFSTVTINKIGGDFLSFYISKELIGDQKKLYTINSIKVNFDDGTSIVVTGRISNIIRIRDKLYCEFKYINILESIRDMIFKQIFKKQAEFRKSLINAMIGN